MKASPTDQNELLRLQTADTRVQQLDHTIRNLPELRELAALAPQIDEVRLRLNTKSGELEDARTELRRVESDVEVVEARIARDSARLETTSSMKDVHGLEQELASLRKRRDDLEEIELGVMERIEALEGEYSEIGTQWETVSAQVEALEKAADVERSALEAQKSALGRDRAAVAGALPPELVELYEKQRARYGVGAALLVRGVSMGSNVALTESDLAVLRRAAPDDVTLCPDSGAILIRNDESGL